MNLNLKLTKIDILTMVLLSILFFGMASWNLGRIDAPVTNWESTTQESFYIDLGSNQNIQKIYFWVKFGNATAKIFSGTPYNWNYIGQYPLQDRATDYSVQKSVTLNVDTRYLYFEVEAEKFDSRPDFWWGVPNPTDKEPSPHIKITEIGLQSQANTQIPVLSIATVNATNANLDALIDEQDSIEIPPTYMSKMYFDEVYFARSAENFAHHEIPKERTHPPLGKLIQTVGVLVFGETPFGWRIMGVIFGALLVPLMFLLGKKLFGTWIGGFSASFLFSFDFMHFTMARIGTTDTYVVFFSLLTQLFFIAYFMNVLKEGWKTEVLPLFIAVVFAALAFSVKWFSLYGVFGMLALLAALRFKKIIRLKASLSERYVAFFNHPFLLLIAFAGVFAVIYFATYIPEMLLGNTPLDILDLQNWMLSFHGGQVIDSSAAPWWSWPLMFRLDGYSVPKWFDITYLPNETASTISAFGNPVVWWVGFACMILVIVEAFHIEQILGKIKKIIAKSVETVQVSIRGSGWDITAIYIGVIYLFSWLPYVLISRATFIYHYYLCVPLLCLAITYFINKYWNNPFGKVAAGIIFVAAVVVFVIFYPVFSGAPASKDYLYSLELFSSWDFRP